MAQNVFLIDDPKTSFIKISYSGSDRLDEIGGFAVVIVIIFFIFSAFLGLIVLGIILSSIFYQQTLTIDKQRRTLALQKLTSIAGITVSQTDIKCALGQVDFFTEETTDTTTVTLRLPTPNNRNHVLKLPLNLNKPDERNIYNLLTSLFQGGDYRAKQIARQNFRETPSQSPRPVTREQHRKPDAYAPNITITDDEMVYKRTLATAKDYWGMYWSFVTAVALIACGISLAFFVVFPAIRTNRALYLFYVPLGLVALGLVLKGIHTIVFKLVATKTAEIVHFNKIAQVVTLENKFLTSRSTQKYLFEQVELKLEKQRIGDGDYLERTYAVVLVFNPTSNNPRKLELMKTRQESQAIELYNTIAEVLDRPRLQPMGA
jgi:hypothetical protein